MKKVLIGLTLVYVFMALVVVNIIIRDESKITYYSDAVRLLSTEGKESSDLKDNDIVTIQINYKKYPEFIVNNLNMDSTKEEISSYRQKIKNNYSAFFDKYNKKIISYLNINDALEVYSSKYAPVIEVSYNIEKYKEVCNKVLSKISSYNLVDNIKVFSSDMEVSPKVELAVRKMGMESIYKNKTYCGRGVKVGILEPGIPDDDHANLVDSNLTIRRIWNYIEHELEHTTTMASIIGGSYGIASEAEMYAVELYLSPTQEIDWLLDNDVDVVNCSFGENQNRGVYSDLSAYFDYISKAYGVTFIAAAGNEGNIDGLVCNPALGYNVIAVGNVGYGNSNCITSSYMSNNGPCKPNVSCYGGDIYVENIGTRNGTSISTAITTGVVACLMEKFPALKGKPEMVNAILSSGSTEPYNMDTTDPNGYDTYAGAGVVNFEKSAIDYDMLARYMAYDYLNDNDNIVWQEQLDMFVDEYLVISANSLAFANGDKDDTYFPKLKINLYKDYFPNKVATSYSSTDNNAFLRYKITEDAVYIIEIQYMGCDGSITYPVNIAYSFDIVWTE